MGGYRGSLIAAMVVFLTINGAAVGGRFYVRTKMITRGLGYDDFALGLTYLGYVIRCGLGFASMYYGYAAEENQPWYDAAKSQRLFFANQLTIYISAGLVKLAVALVLYRLASTKRIKWLLLSSMVIVGIWTIIMTLYTSWLCAKGGSSNYAGSATCARVGYFRTGSNIVIDYFYALLPIYMLWKVQMSMRLRLTVLLLLGLGIFASSATIVKLVVIIRLTQATPEETKGLHYDLLLWADIELGLAIFAASAAALRPLLKLMPGIWDSARRTPKSHNSDAVGPYRELAPGNELHRLSHQTGKAVPAHTEREWHQSSQWSEQ